MNSKIVNYFFLILISITMVSFSTFAENKVKEGGNRYNKTTGSPSRTYLNINNISTQFVNDGDSDLKADGNSGLIYPKGSGKGAVFESGFLWGAKITGDPQVRVGGSAYRHGVQPGKILPNGSPEDPSLPKNRIYRVRPDVFPGGPAVDLSDGAKDEGKSETDLRAQYETDWTEWPVADGAPFTDVDGNGTYDPATDIPGVPGADQTVWFVANDLDPGITTFLYGAQPLGIEMQATFWAYSQTGPLGNMYFRKYKIINKSQQVFNDMIVSMWSDVDLGNSVDDFAGSDTLLSLAYCYNANATDATYNPLPPPAVGFDFFQGPIVASPGDSAIFNGKVIQGFKNLPMTAAYYFARGDAAVTDPTQGDPQGSTQFYNFMQGKIGLSGEFFVDPNTGQTTTFALNGDPVARTGWIDGQLLPGGDRRIGQASGPFQMAVGDTQEVVVAEIVAGATPTVDRITAISLLKFYDKTAQLAYDLFFDLPLPPPAPEVVAVERDKEIVLDWSKNAAKVNATETFNQKGYAFEGYNVYQLPSTTADVAQGKRIATLDIVNGIGKVRDLVFDPVTGDVVKKAVQFGNDTGIKRYLSIKNDELIGGTPLINGIRYYYAVTAYSVNENPDAVPNNLENPLAVITVVPNTNNPGAIVPSANGDVNNADQTGGLANADVTYKVIDPTATTGDTYEVFFTEATFIRNAQGKWEKLTPSLMNKPSDVSASTVDMAAVFGAVGGTVDINCALNLVSPDGNFVDGVKLTFPAGTVINFATPPAFFGDDSRDPTPVITSNVVTIGVSDTSTYGGFAGGEEWVVNVNSFTPPFNVGFEIWDDGWSGDVTDANGTTTINEIGNLTVKQNQWNVKDVTTGNVVVEGQTVYNGVDIYYTDDPTSGPGGSAGPLGAAPGDDANPSFDGIQVAVNGSFDAPISMNNFTLNGDPLPRGDSGPYNLSDYTDFGVIPATAANSQLSVGTSDINLLQKDYEIRYNGTVETQVIGGKNVEVVTSGGQTATLYGARGYDLADHPLNPNPGSNNPFKITVPFEVWSIDDNIQINFMVYDRKGDPAADDPFRVWNTMDRMYTAFVLSPYKDEVIDPAGAEASANATWNMVWWANDFTNGDVIDVFYANPLQLGVDKFGFTTQKATFSADQAKQDVKSINVFPNPYYAVNSEELNKYNRFVTFSHLPKKATIRLFNLAGVHVKTIEKDDASQFKRWDLANENGLPVASGLYIAYIEMPELGETKILKLAIIQEQQILDRF